MKHVMLDCYGSNQTLLNDLKYINKVMNELPYELGLNTINPPSLVPYYYGKVREDDGISSYILFEGGHFTIHTFPYRQCYFIDIFAQDEYDSNILENYLMENLPFNKKISKESIKDRGIKTFTTSPYDENDDFGPHVLALIDVDRKLSMEEMYDFLEHLIKKIGMTPIIRANVIKSTIDNPKFMSGVTMIAESHISLHYDLTKNVIFADIFSCMPFDFSSVTKLFEVLGKVTSYEVVPRGTKHYTLVKDIKQDNEKLASEKWKSYIYR